MQPADPHCQLRLSWGVFGSSRNCHLPLPFLHAIPGLFKPESQHAHRFCELQNPTKFKNIARRKSSGVVCRQRCCPGLEGHLETCRPESCCSGSLDPWEAVPGPAEQPVRMLAATGMRRGLCMCSVYPETSCALTNSSKNADSSCEGRLTSGHTQTMLTRVLVYCVMPLFHCGGAKRWLHHNLATPFHVKRNCWTVLRLRGCCLCGHVSML